MPANLKAAAKKTAAAKTAKPAATKKAPAKKLVAKTAPASPAKTSRRVYTMSTRLATGHVRRNLSKFRRDPLTPEWVGWNLDDAALFATEVKNYLVEKTTLSTSTLDAADYDQVLADYRELAQWKPKRPKKATVRKPGAAVKAATAALEKIDLRITDEPMVPAARAKDTPVTVEVSVPPLTRASLAVDSEAPSRENRRVPQNWRDMCTEADTETARAWWKNWCDRRMRGEV